LPVPAPVVRIDAVGADITTCRQSDNLTLAAAFLATRGAAFVVVGGCALRLHGYDHVPADLDVVPEPSLANVRRLLESVAELGTIGRKRRPTDHALTTYDIVTQTTPVGSIDLMLVTGRKEYGELERAATSMSVKGHAVQVAAINDVLRFRAHFGKPLVDV
jgi:hypothetical protein